jgi:excisionase family DNA binding protein
MDRDRLLTTQELSDYLGVSPRTVQRMAEQGALPYLRVGGPIRGRLRFLVADVVEHLRRTPA